MTAARSCSTATASRATARRNSPPASPGRTRSNSSSPTRAAAPKAISIPSTSSSAIIPTPLIRQNIYSNLPADLPNRFLLWGRVKTHVWDLIAQPIVEYRNGLPLRAPGCLAELRRNSVQRCHPFPEIPLRRFALPEGFQGEFEIHGPSFAEHFQHHQPLQRPRRPLQHRRSRSTESSSATTSGATGATSTSYSEEKLNGDYFNSELDSRPQVAACRSKRAKIRLISPGSCPMKRPWWTRFSAESAVESVVRLRSV